LIVITESSGAVASRVTTWTQAPIRERRIGRASLGSSILGEPKELEELPRTLDVCGVQVGDDL